MGIGYLPKKISTIRKEKRKQWARDASESRAPVLILSSLHFPSLPGAPSFKGVAEREPVTRRRGGGLAEV